MKKIIVLAVSVIMLAALALPAFAAETQIGPTPDGSKATMYQNTVGNTTLTHYTAIDTPRGALSSSVAVDYANDVITLNGFKDMEMNLMFNADWSNLPLEYTYVYTWLGEVEVALDKAIQDSKDVTIEFTLKFAGNAGCSGDNAAIQRFAVMMSDDNGGFQLRYNSMWAEAVANQFTASAISTSGAAPNGGIVLNDTLGQSNWWTFMNGDDLNDVTMKMVRSGDKVTVTATAYVGDTRTKTDFTVGTFDCKGKTALKFCTNGLDYTVRDIKINGTALDLDENAVIENPDNADTADFTSAAIVSVVIAAGAAFVFSKRKHG